MIFTLGFISGVIGAFVVLRLTLGETHHAQVKKDGYGQTIKGQYPNYFS